MPGFRADDLASCIVAQRRFRLQQQKPTALRAATSGFASTNNLASPLGHGPLIWCDSAVGAPTSYCIAGGRIVRVHIRQQKLHDRSHVHLEGDSPHDDNAAQKSTAIRSYLVWFRNAICKKIDARTGIAMLRTWSSGIRPLHILWSSTVKNVKLHRIWRSADGPVHVYVCEGIAATGEFPRSLRP